FRPGTAAGLGLGWDALHRRRPELVYASISGFGQGRPSLAGYDQIAQGTSGLMSITGEPGGAPTKVGVPVGDIVAGMFAAQGIMAALLERARTGAGRYIDVALNDSLLALHLPGQPLLRERPTPKTRRQPSRDDRPLRDVRHSGRSPEPGGRVRRPVQTLLRDAAGAGAAGRRALCHQCRSPVPASRTDHRDRAPPDQALHRRVAGADGGG